VKNNFVSCQNNISQNPKAVSSEMVFEPMM